MLFAPSAFQEAAMSIRSERLAIMAEGRAAVSGANAAFYGELAASVDRDRAPMPDAAKGVAVICASSAISSMTLAQACQGSALPVIVAGNNVMPGAAPRVNGENAKALVEATDRLAGAAEKSVQKSSTPTEQKTEAPQQTAQQAPSETPTTPAPSSAPSASPHRGSRRTQTLPTESPTEDAPPMQFTQEEAETPPPPAAFSGVTVGGTLGQAGSPSPAASQDAAPASNPDNYNGNL